VTTPLGGAGGNDKLLDDRGADYLLGGAGNDVFVTRDDPPSSVTGDDPDSISGGSGIDWAQFDDEDGRASIENVIP
jgi:Ca2+-binding RTX toxin-like protein